MSFRPGKEVEFLKIFELSKDKIRNFEGCTHLELFRDVKNGFIFFTYSNWVSERDLDNYRKSELFQTTWALTKPLFDKKAEAWTVQVISNHS